MNSGIVFPSYAQGGVHASEDKNLTRLLNNNGRHGSAVKTANSRLKGKTKDAGLKIKRQ